MANKQETLDQLGVIIGVLMEKDTELKDMKKKIRSIETEINQCKSDLLLLYRRVAKLPDEPKGTHGKISR